MRTLRNKLEEVDETLSEATFRPEDVRVLQAAGESRDVLQSLERALQHYHSTTDEYSDPYENPVADIITHLDLVTQKLSHALEAVEQQSGKIDLLLDTSIRDQIYSLAFNSPSTSTVSADYGPKMSMGSSLRSYNPSRASTSDTMSFNSEKPLIPSVEEEKEVVVNQTASSPRAGLGIEPNSFKAVTQTWRTPFVYFDPMSIDIDNASSLILSSETGTTSDKPRVLSPATSQPSPIVSVSPRMQQSQSHDNKASAVVTSQSGVRVDSRNLNYDQLEAAATQNVENHVQPPFQRLLNTSSTAKRAVTKRQQSTERHEAVTSPRDLAPTTRPAARLDEAKVDVEWVQAQADRFNNSLRRALSKDGLNGELPTHDHEHNRTLHSTRQPARPAVVSSHSTPPPSAWPRRQESQSRRASHGMKSKYRVVNPDSTNVASPTGRDSEEDEIALKQITSKPRTRSEDGVLPASKHRSPRVELDFELTPASATLTSRSSPRSPSLGLAGQEDIIASRNDSVAETILDKEQVNSVIQAWNACHWDDAEVHIKRHLDRQTKRKDHAMIRRMHHLLGVVASLKGDWQQALMNFVAVINAPITHASQLDAGDCAAAYWMGDTYALLNRKTEALLAYSIAASGKLFHDSKTHRLHQSIQADQEACQVGITGSDFKLHWDRETRKENPSAADSILSTHLITSNAAKSLLEYVSWKHEKEADKKSKPDPNSSRAMDLVDLGYEAGSSKEKLKLRIDHSAFEASGAWPMPFDPYFAMANVVSGRLLASECDLLQTFKNDSAAKIPKTGALSRSAFSCQDFRWLILTLRECLTRLNCGWSEVANSQGTWFHARCPSVQAGIATINYFSIALSRLSFRPGYGVDICSGGMCSARIIKSEPDVDKGVPQDELKRIKSLILRYLEAAARRQEATDLKNTALPVMSVNGGLSLHREASSRSKKPVSAKALSPASTRSGSLLSRVSSGSAGGK